jgi:hypothetical protein
MLINVLNNQISKNHEEQDNRLMQNDMHENYLKTAQNTHGLLAKQLKTIFSSEQAPE